MASLKSDNSISLPSYAKINLSLDVLGKIHVSGKGDYHDLRMIMQTVSLHDDIEVSKTSKSGDISVYCSEKFFIPDYSKNTAYKAAKLIFEYYPLQTAGSGVHIKITKRIPVAGGLAGGSGNAAAVIRAMDKLFNLSMGHKKMCDIGLKIGADVPYCLYGGTMLAEGIGELLTPLPPFPKAVFLLINPGRPLSTADVFSSIKNISSLPHPDTDLLLNYLKNEDPFGFMKNTKNSLEPAAIKFLPCISEIKEALLKKGAYGALMSGSGPTVSGLFKDIGSAEKASEYFSNNYKNYRTFIADNYF